MRRSTGIRVLTSEPSEKQIISFDLEWEPGTYRFRLGGIYDGKKYRSFDSVDRMLRALFSHRYRGAYIYGHYSGASDISFFMRPALEEAVERGKLTMRMHMAQSSAVFVKVSKGKDRWYLCDSFWTFPSDLASMGKAIKLPKLDDSWKCPEHPRCKHSPELKCVFFAPRDVLEVYNRRDCEIVWHSIARFQRQVNEMGSNLKATGASTTLALIRSRYLKSDIPTLNRRSVNERATHAYIASHVSVFRGRADCSINCFDINSSFPASMALPVPGRYLGTKRSWTGDELAIVDADVDVPEDYCPVVPFRSPRDGAVYHPTGRWSSWFTGVDLLALVASGGRVERVRSAMYFEPRTDLAGFVEDIYARKLAADQPDPVTGERDEFMRAFWKRILVSGYGKFAEGEEKTYIAIDGDDIRKGREWVPVAHRHVPIAAIITARSRQLLNRSLRACGQRIWYADTDSVFTDLVLETHPTRLGALKYEKTARGGALFHRPKLYALYDVVTPDGKRIKDRDGRELVDVPKAKGFPGATVSQIEALVRGDDIPMARRMRRPSSMVSEFRAWMAKMGSPSGSTDAIAKGLMTALRGVPSPLDPSDGSRNLRKRLRDDIRPKRAPDGTNNSRPWRVEELSEPYRTESK